MLSRMCEMSVHWCIDLSSWRKDSGAGSTIRDELQNLLRAHLNPISNDMVTLVSYLTFGSKVLFFSSKLPERRQKLFFTYSPFSYPHYQNSPAILSVVIFYDKNVASELIFGLQKTLPQRKTRTGAFRRASVFST